MARKETQEIVSALLNGVERRGARTTTDGTSLFLHGNKIATVYRNPFGGINRIEMTLAGWPTVTTRERLNGLIQAWAQRVTGTYTQAGFSQRKGKQFFRSVNGTDREITADEIVSIEY